MPTWCPATSYDELRQPPDWPLSRLYHQESKLSDAKGQIFQEAIAEFAADQQAVRQSTQSYKTYPGRRAVALPKVRRRQMGRSLRSVLSSRRTRRGEFVPKPLRLRQLGTLLDLACGRTGQIALPERPDLVQELRAWPSGGALYPIETYLIAMKVTGLKESVYHYQVNGHQLEEIASRPSDERMRRAVYAEGLWDNAAALLVLTGIFARTQRKYGERGYRFVLLDAGHLAQNLLLVGEEMKLAVIPLGGFFDDEVAGWLGVSPEDESPLYLFLLGRREAR